MLEGPGLSELCLRFCFFVCLFFFWLAFSLENIYKELSTDIDGFVHPGHGDLSGWARQGKPATARCVLDGFQLSFLSSLLIFLKDTREEPESSNKMAKVM